MPWFPPQGQPDLTRWNHGRTNGPWAVMMRSHEPRLQALYTLYAQLTPPSLP